MWRIGQVWIPQQPLLRVPDVRRPKKWAYRRKVKQYVAIPTPFGFPVVWHPHTDGDTWWMRRMREDLDAVAAAPSEHLFSSSRGLLPPASDGWHRVLDVQGVSTGKVIRKTPDDQVPMEAYDDPLPNEPPPEWEQEV